MRSRILVLVGLSFVAGLVAVGVADAGTTGGNLNVVVVNGDGGVTPVGKVDERGPVRQTAGCLSVVCSTAGDGGILTLPVGTRYISTVDTNSAVRVNDGACVSYAVGSGVGPILNEGSVQYWTAPVGTGPDGGVVKYQCCANSATATTPIWQMCPAP